MTRTVTVSIRLRAYATARTSNASTVIKKDTHPGMLDAQRVIFSAHVQAVDREDPEVRARKRRYSQQMAPP
jgi:hypothetical protein